MINITLSLVVKIKSYLSKNTILKCRNKFFWFMRTESQQTDPVNFPHKNNHKKAYALHHTYHLKEKTTNKQRNTAVVSTNVTNVTTVFICDANHAIY